MLPAFSHHLYRRAHRMLCVPARYLNLQEYQCKQLLSEFDVNVQRFVMAKSLSDIDSIKKQFKVREFVVKAQILAGGRGKGVFSDGFKGGVHLTKNPNEMADLVKRMLGNHLRTKQTPKDGVLVSNVMVAEALDIARETYFAILMDRTTGAPLLVACREGGVEIEEVAAKRPEAVLRTVVDIDTGVTQDQADRIASHLGFTTNSKLHGEAAEQVIRLYKLFSTLDCLQVEINPFGETPDGRVVCFDAKLSFDENAVFRQPRISQMAAEVEAIEVAAAGPQSTLALEADASRHGLNYIGLPDGDIGCVVNGAGLAMATMDLIHRHGGKPANFLDLGGGVSAHQVAHAIHLITVDPRIRCIFVNIFGGIVNCATVADGMIDAYAHHPWNVPIVIRMEGNHGSEARSKLASSSLPLIVASELDEAANLAVHHVQAS